MSSKAKKQAVSFPQIASSYAINKSLRHSSALQKAIVCLLAVVVLTLSSFDIDSRLLHQSSQNDLQTASQQSAPDSRSSLLLAEAKVLGKMAKVWYIKKKIKKLHKKLKKHTIALPVFTAIPIYEHSYYPHAPMHHMVHPAMHHHHAASNQLASLADPTTGQQLVPAASNHLHQQQVAAAASSHHPMLHHPSQHHQHYVAAAAAAAAYQAQALAQAQNQHHSAASNHPPEANSAPHIINAYTPQPAMFIDNTGGIYGHYNNAFGHRYNGGYQLW